MEQAVAPQLDEFVSEDAFERICQAWLRERVEEAVEAGRWWGPIRRREGGKLRSRAYEADAVAVGESGEVLALGSCKWSASAAHEHSAAELDKLELIREELGAPQARLYFFDRVGFSRRLRELAGERDDIELVLARDLG